MRRLRASVLLPLVVCAASVACGRGMIAPSADLDGAPSSDDGGDESEAGAFDAEPANDGSPMTSASCTWILDGAVIECPADYKTFCPAPDGCNVCRCWDRSAYDAGLFMNCTSHPCSD